MSTQISSELRNLARYREALRKLFRATELAARKIGLTPQQHLLLVGAAGLGGTEGVTISRLAEFLQLRHHTVVELVDRAEAQGYVIRKENPRNKREVFVVVTPAGLRKLRQLATEHRRELQFMRRRMDILDIEKVSTRGPRRP
ncbi:MAG: MarR family transcriptional regulator [Candidatus Binatia bacterium]|nr:MarR family transcriptional regulator [Candidatus Binatia bacterium]